MRRGLPEKYSRALLGVCRESPLFKSDTLGILKRFDMREAREAPNSPNLERKSLESLAKLRI